MGFRVTDGAEVMFGHVRRLPFDGDNIIFMQGDISNAYGSPTCWPKSCTAPCSTTGSAVCLTLRDRKVESGDKPAAGLISYADDFMTRTKQVDANATLDKRVAALKEIGLETDAAKSHYSRE